MLNSCHAQELSCARAVMLKSCHARAVMLKFYHAQELSCSTAVMLPRVEPKGAVLLINPNSLTRNFA